VLTLPGMPPQGTAMVASRLAQLVAGADEPPTETTLLEWASELRTLLVAGRISAALEAPGAMVAALRMQVYVRHESKGAPGGDVAVGPHQRLEDLKRRAARR
jgi:hypothetical protein